MSAAGSNPAPSAASVGHGAAVTASPCEHGGAVAPAAETAAGSDCRVVDALGVPDLVHRTTHQGALTGLDEDAEDGEHQQQQRPAEAVRDRVGEVATAEGGGVPRADP